MAVKKNIGRVSELERDEIKKLFERKNSLKELSKVLDASNEKLYNRLLEDVYETSAKYQNWWDRMAMKYSWEGRETGNWNIDFATCIIYLVTPE